MLNGSSALPLVRDLTEQIRMNYLRLGEPPESLREYQWAWQVVASRAFSIEEAGRNLRALVPGADMLDHRLPAETKWGYDERAKVFRMTALRDFQAGEIVHDSYGSKSNRRLLVYYGFTDPGNEADEATLCLPPPPAGHQHYRLMGEIVEPSADRDYRYTVTVTDQPPEGMLSYLRLHNLVARETITVTREGGTSVVAVNRRNEAAALGFLREACRASLAAFETTIAEDESLLRDPGLTINARNAVIVRRGEKRVLHHYLQMAETVMPLLSLPSNQFARKTIYHPTSAAPFRQYLGNLRRAFGC
jgi:histone-lysine N-methyltransferase SETD3